jgi:hypothetical protein
LKSIGGGLSGELQGATEGGEAREKQKGSVGRKRPFPESKNYFSLEEGNGIMRNTTNFQGPDAVFRQRRDSEIVEMDRARFS